ncbi:MAG: TetR/AcrR family transcriptional regulator [Rhodobacteraceae bacterium]|nr:TetR/AcrR family transcriptional regulator [Paracoccaceae bacterium]
MTTESTPDAPENPRRRPKGTKRARTRTALLQAARALTREKGYEHTTMEDIAERAGMSTGAIYGNFRNRDELFIALAEANWPPIAPVVPPGADVAQLLGAMAEAVLAGLPDRQASAVGYLTGRAYALGHEAVRHQARERTAAAYAEGADWLAATVPAADLPAAPEVMVRVIHALTEGLILQRLLTPELIDDEVIRSAFALLAGPK